MLKKKTTPQEVCDLLNEMLKLDYNCTKKLIEYRVPCNKKIADHPTIQVTADEKLGIMGIINSLFGIRDDFKGAICYEFESNRIIRFILTPEEKTPRRKK